MMRKIEECVHGDRQKSKGNVFDLWFVAWNSECALWWKLKDRGELITVYGGCCMRLDVATLNYNLLIYMRCWFFEIDYHRNYLMK